MLPNALKQESGPTSVLNAPQQKGISLIQQPPNSASPNAVNQQSNAAQKVSDKAVPNNCNSKAVKEKRPGYLEQLWRALIRPPNRINYRPAQLGPTSFVLDKTVIVKREDFKVKNSRGFNLECSYFEPIQTSGKPHPCVLYLHGNSSSRNEGIVLVQYLVTFGISLVLMDFSGCGISEGEFISLGYYEKFDAKAVMDHVKKWKPITEFGLWGRSMGAATTLMTSLQEDLSIRFIVIDSSFISIKQLCEEIAKDSYKIPKWIVNWAYQYIRGKVKGLANFDLENCNAQKAVENPKNKPSALFLVAKGDTLISPSHSQKLYNLFRGSKRILMFEGTHNSRRPREINQEITKFFYNGLFDQHAMKKLNAFKMVPELPNFSKQDAVPNNASPSQPIIQNKGNPPPVGPNSIISMANPPSIVQKSGGSISGVAISNVMSGINNKIESSQSVSITNLQNKIRYEPSGQLKSKNVEKDEVLQEEEEEDGASHINPPQQTTQKDLTNNLQTISTEQQINNINNNHISKPVAPPMIPSNQPNQQRITPKSTVVEPSIQGDIDAVVNGFKFKGGDSFSKIAPSEFQVYQVENGNGNKLGKMNSVLSNVNTINHNSNNILPHGPIPIHYQLSQVNSSHIHNNTNSVDDAGSGVQDKQSVDRYVAKNNFANNQIHFSNFRQVQQANNQYDDNFLKEESKIEGNDNERLGSEDSKVYSMNIANLPSQHFQGNLNTEGQEQSPRQPKSQYNFDSNNILINFQRYNNNPNQNNGNPGSLIVNGMLNNGSIINQNPNKNQDIKEEEDTQFNSKIDKFDQDNVNQNIGLSGFYIPPDPGSQVHQSGVQQNVNNNNMVSSIMNRVASPSPQHQQNSDRVPYPVFQHTNSQIGNVPLDNTMVITSPDKSPSQYQFQDFKTQPHVQGTQVVTSSVYSITNANPMASNTQQNLNQNNKQPPQQQLLQQNLVNSSNQQIPHSQPSIFSLQKVLQFQ